MARGTLLGASYNPGCACPSTWCNRLAKKLPRDSLADPLLVGWELCLCVSRSVWRAHVPPGVGGIHPGRRAAAAPFLATFSTGPVGHADARRMSRAAPGRVRSLACHSDTFPGVSISERRLRVSGLVRTLVRYLPVLTIFPSDVRSHLLPPDTPRTRLGRAIPSRRVRHPRNLGLDG